MLHRGQPRPIPSINLGPAHPLAQRLRRTDTQLASHRIDRGVLQGVGGALLTPGALAILQASFDPAERAKAIGAWSGLGGMAGAVGPFLGGWLVQVSSWRLVFLTQIRE